MERPWHLRTKTWRDKLFDCAARLSDIGACEGDEEGGKVSTMDDTERQTVAILSIEKALGIWRQEWLSTEYPGLHIQCMSECAPQSCICSAPAAALLTNDFVMLQVEYWSMQLLVSLQLVKRYAKRITLDTAVATPSTPQILFARSELIAHKIEEALVLPVFGQSEAHFGGMTEGLCRTIMPSWILKQWKAQRHQCVW